MGRKQGRKERGDFQTVGFSLPCSLEDHSQWLSWPSFIYPMNTSFPINTANCVYSWWLVPSRPFFLFFACSFSSSLPLCLPSLGQRKASLAVEVVCTDGQFALVDTTGYPILETALVGWSVGRYRVRVRKKRRQWYSAGACVSVCLSVCLRARAFFSFLFSSLPTHRTIMPATSTIMMFTTTANATTRTSLLPSICMALSSSSSIP